MDPALKQYPDETSVQHVLVGIPEAEPFADVGPAITALHEAGIKASLLLPTSCSMRSCHGLPLLCRSTD